LPLAALCFVPRAGRTALNVRQHGNPPGDSSQAERSRKMAEKQEQPKPQQPQPDNLTSQPQPEKYTKEQLVEGAPLRPIEYYTPETPIKPPKPRK
jgi:hypothetical protein